MTDWAGIQASAQLRTVNAPSLAVVGALDVAANASEFAPQTMPDQPSWMENWPKDDQPTRGSIEGWQVDQWALHRYQVTTREAENASRLSALCWAIVTLRGSDDDPTAAAMGDELARKTNRWYPRLRGLLPDEHLPDSPLERRPYISSAARDWRALPRRWRDLGGVSKKARRDRSDDRPQSAPTPMSSSVQAALPGT